MQIRHKAKQIISSESKEVAVHSLFSGKLSLDFMQEVKCLIYAKKATHVHVFDIDVAHPWKMEAFDFLFSLPAVQLVFHFNTSSAVEYKPAQVEPRIFELLENFRTRVLPHYEKSSDDKPLITCQFQTSDIEKEAEYQNIFKLSSLEAIDESDDDLLDFGEAVLPPEYKENKNMLATVYMFELAKRFVKFDHYIDALTHLLIAYADLITIHAHEKFYIMQALKKEVPEMFIEVCQLLKVNNVMKFIEARDIIDKFAVLINKPNGSGITYPQFARQIALIQHQIFERIGDLKTSQSAHSRIPSGTLVADTPPMDHKRSSSPLLSQSKFRITPPMDRKEVSEKVSSKKAEEKAKPF